MSISLDQQSKVSYNLFIFFVQVEDYQNILNLRCRPMVLLHVKPFEKNKKRSVTSLPASFSTRKRNLSCYILLTDQVSLSVCLYFFRYLAICLLRLHVIQKLGNSHSFPLFPCHWCYWMDWQKFFCICFVNFSPGHMWPGWN